jgi:hypothetical protein
LSNPGIVKGFVTKRLLTWHVTKQSYVNCWTLSNPGVVKGFVTVPKQSYAKMIIT